MAEAKHYKLSRKELRDPDEFQVVTGQAFDWLRTNQSAVVGAVSAIVALAAVVLGVNWYSARQADAATARLQSAQTMFESKKYAESATEFAAIASEYGSTPAGKLASLYRARALAAQPDPAAAATAYGEYLAGTPETEYLRQEALLGLGRVRESQNDRPGATDSYRQAADIEGPFRTLARLSLARLEDAAGNADKARALYVEILKAPDLDGETRQSILNRLPADARPKADAPPDAVAQ